MSIAKTNSFQAGILIVMWSFLRQRPMVISCLKINIYIQVWWSLPQTPGNLGRVTVVWKSARTVQETQGQPRVHARLCVRKKEFIFTLEPIIKIKLRGWKDGFITKGVFHQAWQSELDHYDPHDVRRTDSHKVPFDLQKYNIVHVCLHTHTCIHTTYKVIYF